MLVNKRGVLVVLCVTLSFICNINADTSSCIAACDSVTQTGQAITICGSDLITHNTFQGAYAGSNSCYMKCGVALYHVGPCGCPNNCYSDFSRGKCGENNTCECEEGWGGADCSSVKCPNSCSNNGVCGTVEGQDGCECSTGWTGNDCGVAVEPLLSLPLPYQQIIPGNYYKDDKYEDEHPLLRPHLLATVKMYINNSDWLNCLYPQNLYNQSYVYGDFIFNNGIASKTITNVGIRVKGAVSRSDPKKSWSIKFNTEKGREWKGLKGVGLKTASGGKILSNQLTVEFYRAFLVQTYRTSFAEFWINDIFVGLYTVQEKFDDNFLQSRYNVKDSYLYKIGWYDMSYKGPNATVYSHDLLYSFDKLNPINCIEESEGDGNWTSFIDFVYNLNQSIVSTSSFDVDSFIRAMVLEAFIQNMDGYNGIGNNYLFANSNKKGLVWQFIAQDFDFAMSGGFGGGGGGNNNNNGGGNIGNVTGNNNNNGGGGNNGGGNGGNGGAANIGGNIGNVTGGANIGGNGGGGGRPGGGGFGFGSLSSNIFLFPSMIKPLTKAVFSVPGSNETYAMYAALFLNGTFNNNNVGVTVARLEAYARLANSSVAKDRFYSATTGQNVTSFWTSVATVKTWLNTRVVNVTSQLLNATFPTSAPTSSPSSSPSPSSSSSSLDPSDDPTPSPSPSSTTSPTDQHKESNKHVAALTVGVVFGVVSLGGILSFFVYYKFILPYREHKRINLLNDMDDRPFTSDNA